MLLQQALTVWEDSLCRCGCGGYADECTDPDLQDEWEGRVGVNYRRGALERFREDAKSELEEPGAYAYLVDVRRDESAAAASQDDPEDHQDHPE